LKLDPFHDLDVIIVCGLPASGKSHFSREHFNRDGRKRVNRTEIRRSLYEMTNFGEPWNEAYFESTDEGLVKHVERRIVEHLLHEGEKLLIDNTSVTIASRKSYLAIARQMRKSIGVIFLHTPLKTCIQRNGARTFQVPDVAIVNLSVAIELPRSDEGFDELLILGEN
jgi:predicted kinase